MATKFMAALAGSTCQFSHTKAHLSMAHKQGEPGCSVVVCMARIESTASTPGKCMAWTGHRCIKLHGKNVSQTTLHGSTRIAKQGNKPGTHTEFVDMVEQ
jgi:hypothetical protein